MDKINTVHYKDWLTNDLPDKSVQLIIADPPYYKTKGDFDFIWDSFEDYLVDVEKWAIECKRILADNGTLFWYGSSKRIAYAQIIFDKHFNLLSNITCHIFDRQTNKIPAAEARSFISTTERVLMYTKENEDTDLQVVNNDINNYSEIREYFNEERSKLGKSLTWINREILGYNNGKDGMAGNILSVHKKGWSFPTKEQYLKLQKTGFFKKEYLEIKERYKLYRIEYEELRRPFNPTEKYKMDVLRVSQEGHITGKYDHDTVKPEKLTRILIRTCSRKGDVLVVPFAGSGTECAMGVKEGLKVYGYEITEKHAIMSNKRIKQILDNPTLF